MSDSLPPLSQIAYSVEDAARLCGVSENTMRELIASGQIYAPKMGNLRVGRVELERFLLGLPRTSITVATTVQVVATHDESTRPDMTLREAKEAETRILQRRRK